ncbi:hypothetical protein MPH_00785 [Macrophomina phaseolina MS6]|uniref:Uncharacterized protein n=1 Tax=Macrophomina phaseolina (strain MS6) TaxID=1126212 RepID=K2SZ20_MACPH|nr:hypothetical protein MPH_00785 [Macrophomina phaseolina MS6]
MRLNLIEQQQPDDTFYHRQFWFCGIKITGNGHAGLEFPRCLGAVLAAQPFTVLICEDVYFQGRCDFVIREFGFCQRLSADWVNRISSIQPGKDSVCGIYATNNCTGLADQMVWPGSSDLVGSKFNDFSSSLRCWKSA